VVNPKHPLARAGEVSIRQLGALNFIARQYFFSAAAEVIETFRRHKTPLRMGVELLAGGDQAVCGDGQWSGAGAGADGADGAGERRAGSGAVKELQLERRLRLDVPAAGEPVTCGGVAFLKVVEAVGRGRHGDPIAFRRSGELESDLGAMFPPDYEICSAKRKQFWGLVRPGWRLYVCKRFRLVPEIISRKRHGEQPNEDESVLQNMPAIRMLGSCGMRRAFARRRCWRRPAASTGRRRRWSRMMTRCPTGPTDHRF